METETVRVVPAPKWPPLTQGDPYQNPPGDTVADRLAHLERGGGFDPQEHRRAAVVEILGGLRVAKLATLYIRDCARALSDHSEDAHLNKIVEHFDYLTATWERDL